MTRTHVRHPRRSTKAHHYQPTRVKLSDLVKKPTATPTPPRLIYAQEPYFTQMLCGDKVVEVRPYYKKWHDLAPGQLVEFRHRSSGSSFTARITRKRFHRHVVSMLRTESIRACLPDHDPDDLQRAVNTYYSFCDGLYKQFFRKHGVVSFRFTRVDPDDTTPPPDPNPFGDYDKNSLCSMFEAVNRSFRGRPNKFTRM